MCKIFNTFEELKSFIEAFDKDDKNEIEGFVFVDQNNFMFKYKTMATDLGMVRMNNVVMNDPVTPGLTTTRNITGWEAMYVYLMNRQGFGKRVQQGTQVNINDIIDVLSPEEKQFADAMSNQLMDMFERSFGKSAVVPNYFPIQDAVHEYFKEVSINSLMER